MTVTATTLEVENSGAFVGASRWTATLHCHTHGPDVDLPVIRRSYEHDRGR